MGTKGLLNFLEKGHGTFSSRETYSVGHSIGVRNDLSDVAVNSGCSLDATVVPPIPTTPSNCRLVMLKRSIRSRRGTHVDALDTSSDEESDYEQHIKASRGWNPKDGCRPIIDEAPVFYPTEEEFKDPLGYISSIRMKAEQCGICRIVPPISWKPPCPLKDKGVWECAKFTTRIQQIDKLQNREPLRKKSKSRVQRKRKKRKFRFGMTRRRNVSEHSEVSDCGSDNDETFGFQSGSDFTLDSFKKFADKFKEHYFGIKKVKQGCTSDNLGSQKRWEPSVEDIEGEYWRMVEKPSEEIEVHYGADLETGAFGSGFPKITHLCGGEGDANQYVLSGWNLNNLPRLPGSALCFEKEDISGVLVPWLYIGMCFSSFCWHVEDHHLYSLNYMHFGDPKLWYGVPGSDAVKLENAMRKHLPKLFKEQPHLLNELVTQLSPTVLKSEGVPVYRAVQNAGEFVLTFPRAYHSGFNCGFNCAEAVNVAPLDWLLQGQCAIELYSEQCRKTSVSHDKLLLSAADEAIRSLWESSFGRKTSDHLRKGACGKDGVLTKAVKERVEIEKKRREVLFAESEIRRMDKKFDFDDRECIYCFYDLYLSAAGCACSPNRFTCLKHTEMLCSCDASRRFYLFRYDINQLSTLVEALEDNQSSLYKWCIEHLGLAQTLNDVQIAQSKLASELNLINFPKRSIFESQEPTSDIKGIDAKIFDQARHGQRNKFESNDFPSRVLKARNGQKYNDPCKLSRVNSSDTTKLNCQGSGLVCKFNLKQEKGMSKVGSIGADSDVSHLHSHSLEDNMNMGGPFSCAQGGMLDCYNGEKIAVLVEETKVNSPVSIKEEQVHNFSSSKQEFCSSLQVFRGGSCEIVGSSINSESMRTYNNATQQDGGQSCDIGTSMLSGPDLRLLQTSSSTSSDSWPSDCISFGKPLTGVERCLYQSGNYVELLELGITMHGRAWCSRQAIFPKGYRSRVRFTSVLDPTKMCSYISEVADAGIIGPLFKVTIEERPKENFTGTSPVRCWEMVQNRLEQEITRLNIQGKSTPLPAVLNGLEMFGFLSPPIIQAFEDLDPYHKFSEYWEAKRHRRSRSEEERL